MSARPAPGPRTALLLLSHRGNRRRLEQWLREEAGVEIVERDAAQPDLVVVDGPALERERPWLEAARAADRAGFLPCLFVTPHSRVTLVTGELWRVVDEVLTTPIRSEELRVRLERLLALREQALQAAARAEELSRSNVELEQFAFVAAHELAAPLTNVFGFVHMLEARYRGRLDRDGDLFLAEALKGCARMQQMIDDLLAYARAGRAPALERVDVGAVVADALAALAAVVQEKQAELAVAELPAVRADPAQLGLVFRNLLGNALKFAAPGVRPRVRVDAEQRDGSWCFAVRDDGIGISPEEARAVFAMFARVQARDDYPGTGVGLAICQKIVERHGGRIWAEPGPEGGSVFRFTLPAEGCG